MKHLTPDVILRNLIENTDFENVVYVLLEKPWGSWCCSCANNFLCVFPSLCFSDTFMRAVGWANVANSDLIFKSASFRYWWEPEKQDNNFPCVFVNKIVTKMPQKDKNSILNVVSGGFRWMEVPCFDNDLSRRRNALQSEFLTEFPPKLRFFQTS